MYNVVDETTQFFMYQVHFGVLIRVFVFFTLIR